VRSMIVPVKEKINLLSIAGGKDIEDFATAPGVTIQDSLEALGMSQTELAERAGISNKTINRIIEGIDPVTHATALAFEKVLQVPVRFWLKLEANYRQHLAIRESL